MSGVDQAPEPFGSSPTASRCSHCQRRIRNSTMTITKDGANSRFCGDRSACRRAAHETLGEEIAIGGASTEAFGAALIAGDYVEWPWWARIVPRASRDRLRVDFAERMAAAVEQRARRAALGGES
jgi:hypothetical protein